MSLFGMMKPNEPVTLESLMAMLQPPSQQAAQPQQPQTLAGLFGSPNGAGNGAQPGGNTLYSMMGGKPGLFGGTGGSKGGAIKP